MEVSDVIMILLMLAAVAGGAFWWLRLRPATVGMNPHSPQQPSSLTQVPVEEASNDPCLLVIHLQAHADKAFVGYDLLQSLLGANLRFGSMSIFHRYGEVDGQSCELFSVAQSTEPGTFDMGQMGAIACEGLSFFMDASSVQDPLRVFDLMINTAQDLCDELGGELQASDRQPLTQSHLEQYVAQIQSRAGIVS